MEKKKIIEVKDLCLRIGNRNLINNINWSVGEGENWLIFGMNGSGKTTLLSVLAGFQSYTYGMLKVLGVEYTSRNLFSLRKRIGFVSNSFFGRIYKNETVLEIVLSGLFGHFGLEYSLNNEEIRRAKHLLAELNVLDKIDQSFVSLSKGEQQCVLIARALISRPQILLLDEPCTGLDVYAREKMMNIVQELATSRHVSIVYVTHYLEEVKPYLNRTALLKHGRFIRQGLTEDVLTDTNLSLLMTHEVVLKQCYEGPKYAKISTSSNLANICYGGEA